MRRRAPLPLLLALAGALQALWSSAASTDPALPHPAWTTGLLAGGVLLFAPGWGLLRCLSSVDRKFGVAGAALVLSLLLLGLVPRGLPHGAPGLTAGLHAASVGLCLLGTWRLARHDRRMASLPPHPAPMPLLPERWRACLVVAALALGATALASPLGAPSTLPGTATWRQAVEAQDLARGMLAGDAAVVSPDSRAGVRGLLAPAAASLVAATPLQPLDAVALVGLAALLATLLLAAECCSRLWGNQGGLAAMLAVLLGLHPAALLATRADAWLGGSLGRALGVAPATLPGGLLAPFVAHQETAVALACFALLLSSTLSVLRRASHHVPRLVGAAACGLVLTLPSATWLWLPGWVLGAGLAHLACRSSPDNHGDHTNPWRRPGDPRILRAPFWRLVLPLLAGAALGASLSGPLRPEWSPSLARLGLALLAWAPAALLFLPGIRSLHAAPGREAFFYVGLYVVALPVLALSAQPPVAAALPLGVTLLWLPLAVTCGIAVARWTSRPRPAGRAVMGLLIVLALPASTGLLARALAAEHPLQSLDGRLQPVEADRAELAAWEPFRNARQLAGPRSLLLADASAMTTGLQHVPVDVDALRLVCDLPLFDLGAAGRLAEVDPRHRAALMARAGRLQPLRALPGVGTAELLLVNPDHGPPPPGFSPVVASTTTLAVPPSSAPDGQTLPPVIAPDPSRLSRARPPDIVLVTVSGLSSADLEHLPRLTAAVRRRGVVAEAITPAPARGPGLADILTLPDGGDLSTRLEQMGWRSLAVVSAEPSDAWLAPLLSGFDVSEAHARWELPARLERALDALATPATAPRFLWWHADDLELPLRAPTGDLGERAWPSARWQPGETPALNAARRDQGLARRRRLLQELDQGLARLLDSLGAEDLFVLTAPFGRHDIRHPSPFDAGLQPLPGESAPDAAFAALHVPLLMCGPEVRAAQPPADRLHSTGDLAGFLVGDDWPLRDELRVLGTRRIGRAPDLPDLADQPDPFDASSRGPARRLAAALRRDSVLLLTDAGSERGTDAPPAGRLYRRGPEGQPLPPERIGGPAGLGSGAWQSRLAELAAWCAAADAREAAAVSATLSAARRGSSVR